MSYRRVSISWDDPVDDAATLDEFGRQVLNRVAESRLFPAPAPGPLTVVCPLEPGDVVVIHGERLRRDRAAMTWWMFRTRRYRLEAEWWAEKSRRHLAEIRRLTGKDQP